MEKNKYSNSCVVRKKILNEKKKHNPPPLKVKWSVPYILMSFDFPFVRLFGVR